MFLKQLLSYFFVSVLIDLPDTGAENVFSAVRDKTVHLPCRSHCVESHSVSLEWRKNSKLNSAIICQYSTIDFLNKTSSGNCSDRFTLNTESLTLSIKDVQVSDSGNYICKITRIIPPPTCENIAAVTLHVKGLTLQEYYNNNSSCVHLNCSLEALNPEQVNFTWIREGQSLTDLSSSVGMSSELHLCKPAWKEKDTITCEASLFNRTLNTSIELNSSKEGSAETPWLLIITCSAAAGIIVSLIFVAVLYNCRKRQNGNGSIVFSNKVYENFSFAMGRQNMQSTSTAKPQGEECIYEN